MLKVLVVEDEEMIRKGIVLTVDWQNLGCSVVAEAANGIEALRACQQYDPDLIITDLKMPQMDGIEMLQQLRAQGSRAVVIILPAYNDFTYAQSALRLGAVDYLLKPFHDGELESAIARARKRISILQQKQTMELLPGIKAHYDSKYVMEALAFISGNYQMADISVSSIARHLGISEGHLSHTFKRETGHTLLGYLTSYRIHKAKQLLKDYRIKIYEVAERVGYQDIAYFSSTFKKLVGVSPSEFQNSNRS